MQFAGNAQREPGMKRCGCPWPHIDIDGPLLVAVPPEERVWVHGDVQHAHDLALALNANAAKELSSCPVCLLSCCAAAHLQSCTPANCW